MVHVSLTRNVEAVELSIVIVDKQCRQVNECFSQRLRNAFLDLTRVVDEDIES